MRKRSSTKKIPLYLEDVDQFRDVEKPFVYQLYGGYSIFDDDKWHPCFKVQNQWFAITHSASSDAIIVNSTKMTGRWYGKDHINNSYLIKCGQPLIVGKRVNGYIYIKPFAEYFKSILNVSSITNLINPNQIK